MDKQHVSYDIVEDDARYDKMIQVNRHAESSTNECCSHDLSYKYYKIDEKYAHNGW